MSKPRKSTEPEPEPDTVLDAVPAEPEPTEPEPTEPTEPAAPAEFIVPEYGVSMEEISRRQRPADPNPLN